MQITCYVDSIKSHDMSRHLGLSHNSSKTCSHNLKISMQVFFKKKFLETKMKIEKNEQAKIINSSEFFLF